jgi:hypothetical protein
MLLFTKTTLLALGTALLLSGCWTPPNADVRPPGPSRVIQKGIVVQSAIRLGVVQSVNAATRTVVMQVPGTPGVHTYTASQRVTDLGRLHEGTKVRATVSEELTVYVSSDGRPPGADVPEGMEPTARILSLDPSFRVLTLQNRDGGRETFKVGLDVRLDQMQAGDDVMIQTAEIVSLAAR